MHPYSVDQGFFKGKRVLLTGHTGFKGSWLALWLARLGAEITGYALEPDSEPNLFGLAQVAPIINRHVVGDVRDLKALRHTFQAAAPEIVFHLAAQPLVRRSYETPVETFATNALGTAHVLECIRQTPVVRVAVIVTTDKVYQNREWVHPYRETDSLGGHDPYSASKACAELIAECYRRAFFDASPAGMRLATVRAGNVIGGGDWSQDRLFPDMVRAWQRGQPLKVRHPQAVRPWQHVLEPLAWYLRLAAGLWHDPALAGAWNLGPHAHEETAVREVALIARQCYGYGDIEWGGGTEGPHEAGHLSLDNAKARRLLGFAPRWGLQEAVQRTMRWYRGCAEGHDARALCDSDIDDYEGSP